MPRHEVAHHNWIIQRAAQATQISPLPPMAHKLGLLQCGFAPHSRPVQHALQAGRPGPLQWGQAKTRDWSPPQHRSPCRTHIVQQIACSSALGADNAWAQSYESCRPCVIADRQEACSIWSVSHNLFQSGQIGGVVGVQPPQNQFATQRNDTKGKVTAQASPRGLYRHALWVLAFNSAVHAQPLPAEAPLTVGAAPNFSLPSDNWTATKLRVNTDVG